CACSRRCSLRRARAGAGSRCKRPRPRLTGASPRASYVAGPAERGARTMNLSTARLGALLLAAASGGALAQASTLPLAAPEPAPDTAPMQRQSGMAVINGEHDERTVVRSFEPDSVVGDYRIDFQLLDANGDGV